MTTNNYQQYLQYSQYTYPGLYAEKLKELPDNVPELAKLVRGQIIHRMTLKNGNTGSNADFRYGDTTRVPWWRQPEDDIFPTAAAILTELYRRDSRGFTPKRLPEDKLIAKCNTIGTF